MTESQINVEKEQTEQEVDIEREPFSIGGGGHDYTAGEGLKLQDYEFSADTDVLATKSDLSGKQDTLTAGDNISIEDNTISATDTTYTAGSNVSIEDNTISATDTTYTAGDNITISEDNVISADGGGGGPTVVQTTGTFGYDSITSRINELSVGSPTNTRYISNVTNPYYNQDAATKKYVDDAIAALEARISALEGN